jgi:hypothetical protein
MVFGLLAVGALTQVLLARLGSRQVMLGGLGMFLVALALTGRALRSRSSSAGRITA